MQAQRTIRILRMAEIDGQYFEVPAFVHRSVCGWQVRVTRTETQHLSDSQYGGPLQSLQAATQLAEQQRLFLAHVHD